MLIKSKLDIVNKLEKGVGSSHHKIFQVGKPKFLDINSRDYPFKIYLGGKS